MTLSERTYRCPDCGYTEDRDIKAAKTLLLAGQYEMRVSTHSEHMGTLAEPGSGFEVSYENWKQTRVKPEAATL